MPERIPGDAAVHGQWEQASRLYAEGASGDVVANVGSEVSPIGVWKSAEIPALIDNPNVTNISEIDLVTGEATRVWP